MNCLQRVKDAFYCCTFRRRLFMDNRKHMGKNKEGVIFPIAPNLSEMSEDYLDFINDIKEKIKKQRMSIVLNANSGMICLYLSIGKEIL